MKMTKSVLVAAILGAALLATTSLVRADEGEKDKDAKEPCCAATVEAGLKCEHQCCVKAAKDGKVCEKCHPKKEEKKD